MEESIIMKKGRCLLVIIVCLVLLFFPRSVGEAKEITKGNVNKEISAQRKEVNRAKLKYNEAKQKAKQYKAQHNSSGRGTKSILFGTIMNGSPLIVNSDYALSPTKGWFWIEGGSGGWGSSWTGNVKPTGQYRNWNGHTCQVVKYSSSSLNAYRKYSNQLKVVKKAKKKYKPEKNYLSYLKGLKHSSLALKNCNIVESQEKRLEFSWRHHSNYEKTKWSVSNPEIAKITESGSDYVCIKGKKTGTVTLTAKAAVSEKKSTCKIKVRPKAERILVTSEDGTITYNDNDTVFVAAGLPCQLVASCVPENSADQILFSTSDKKIATVNKDGLIVGKKRGEVKITVYCKYSDAQIELNVQVGNLIQSMTARSDKEDGNDCTFPVGDVSGVAYMQKNINPNDTQKYSTAENADDKSLYEYNERKWDYAYLQKLDSCTPQGMVAVEFLATFTDDEDSDVGTMDSLTCTSSNTNVVVPMYAYHSSYGGNGKVFLGIIGTGDATVTATSRLGATCSWTVHIVKNTVSKLTAIGEPQFLSTSDEEDVALIPTSIPETENGFSVLQKIKEQSTSPYLIRLNFLMDMDYFGVPLGSGLERRQSMEVDGSFLLGDSLTCTSSVENVAQPYLLYYTCRKYNTDDNGYGGGSLYLDIGEGIGDTQITVFTPSGKALKWTVKVDVDDDWNPREKKYTITIDTAGHSTTQKVFYQKK